MTRYSFNSGVVAFGSELWIVVACPKCKTELSLFEYPPTTVVCDVCGKSWEYTEFNVILEG